MRLLRRQATASATGWAEASWHAWPTLSCSGAGLPVAGVDHHRDEVLHAIAHLGGLVTAELRIETGGKYAGAVRVYVGDGMVGAISHDTATDYRNVVEQLNGSNRPATCRAQLEADQYVDVFLCTRPKERAEDEPFLPPILGETVELDAGQYERLDDSMHSRAKAKSVTKTGELLLRRGDWRVVLDDEEIGSLPRRRYRRLDNALGAGFPLTCHVRLVRAVGKPLRVQADFPND